MYRRLKTDTTGRRLRQSQLDQYNASALYGVGVVDKTSHHDVSYSIAGGSIADSAGLRNNEYARMRLQRLAAGQPYRDGVAPYGASYGGPYRVNGAPYGAPYASGPGAHFPPPPIQFMPGVVEHIYESPDLVRRDAFHDEQYTPTNAAAGQQQHHHHQGYWPLPATSAQVEPASPSTQCCVVVSSHTPKNASSLKAKSTGNYSL